MVSGTTKWNHYSTFLWRNVHLLNFKGSLYLPDVKLGSKPQGCVAAFYLTYLYQTLGHWAKNTVYLWSSDIE